MSMISPQVSRTTKAMSSTTAGHFSRADLGTPTSPSSVQASLRLARSRPKSHGREPQDASGMHWTFQALPCGSTPHPTEGSQLRWPDTSAMRAGGTGPTARDWGKLNAREPRWKRTWATEMKEIVVDRGEQLSHEVIKMMLTGVYGSLKRAFEELDFFKDGVLSLIELQEGLYQIFTKTKGKEYAKYRMLCEVRSEFNERVEAIFKQMDVSGDGKVSYEEFARTRLQPVETARQFTARRNSELASVAAGSDAPIWKVMNTNQMERTGSMTWDLSPRASLVGSPISRRGSRASLQEESSGIQPVDAPMLQASMFALPAPLEPLEKVKVKSIPRKLGAGPDTPRANVAAELNTKPEPIKSTFDQDNACSLTIRNASYQKLMASPHLISKFETAIKEAICKEMGNVINSDCVTVSLSSGSIVAQYTISAPHLKEGVLDKAINRLKCSSTLPHTIAMGLARIKGIESICTGRLEVVDISFPQLPELDFLASMTLVTDEGGSTRGTRKIEGSDDFRAFATMLMQKFPTIEQAFKAIDISGEGSLSMTEFDMGVRGLRWGGDAKAVFKEMDLDRNGVLSIAEFSRLMRLPPVADHQVDKFRVKSKKETEAEKKRKAQIPGSLLYHRGTCLAAVDLVRPLGEHVASSAGFFSFDRSPTGRLDETLHPNNYPGQDPEVFSDLRGPGSSPNGPESFAEVAEVKHPLRGNRWKVGSCTSRTERFGPLIPSAQGRADRELSAASFASYEGQAPRDQWSVSGLGSHSLSLRKVKLGPKESFARPLVPRQPWTEANASKGSRSLRPLNISHFRGALVRHHSKGATGQESP